MAVEQIVEGLYSRYFRDWAVHVYYLVDADGVTVIDTGGKGSAPGIVEGLAELGKTPSDVRRIILTHGHQDHAGSAARLATATGAPVLVHDGDAGPVRTGGEYPKLKARTLLGWLILLRRPPHSVEAAPNVQTLGDGEEVAGMRVIHTPGHSPGHVALLWPRHGGVLIAGDTVFNVPYLAAAPLYQDLDGLHASARKLAQLDFEVACFGHGKPIKGGASKRFRAKFLPPQRGGR
jgi:glyoxylase-like metal-dependent hydrolase (beta-lactamase superfamily II)